MASRRYTKTERKKFAQMAKQHGIQFVVHASGAKPDTIKGWIREFLPHLVTEMRLGDIAEGNPDLDLSYIVDGLQESGYNLLETVLEEAEAPPPPLQTSEAFGMLSSDERFRLSQAAWDQARLIEDRAKRFEWMSHHPIPEVRIDAAYETNDPDVLQRLLHDKDEFVRAAAASSELVPMEVLEDLADDAGDDVVFLSGLASNPGVYDFDFPKFRDLLMTSNHVDVRERYAHHTHHAEDLDQLASDEDKLVRLEVVANSSTPTETLQSLTEDTDDRVATEAFRAVRSRKSMSDSSD